MQAQKVIQTKQDIDLDIQEVTLLSREEAENFLTPEQRSIGARWWLRSAHESLSDYAGEICRDGRLYYDYVSNSNGVVPALRISNLASNNLKIGDILEVGGKLWKVISEDLAWCDHNVGRTVFREDYEASDANDYEKSDVKKWLDQWALERGIVTQENMELFHTR